MSGKSVTRLAGLLLVLLAGVWGEEQRVDAWQSLSKVSLPSEVESIMRARCVGCHNGMTSSGGLRLDNPDFIARETIILPGRAERSLLYQRLVAAEGEQMPPVGERLSAREIGLIRSWIDGMASRQEAGGGHWAWQSIVRPEVPGGSNPAGNPIDAFIRERLAREGWGSAPEADRRTLIRRVTFDLTGLPPTPERVAAFIADQRPDAWERLVDELLASPHYGERWARHWLDVVHYGDTHGYDKDKPRPQAWPYRDYVIRALNEDKPYARFIEEQLAGDALYPGTRDGYEALGFIAAGPWDFIGHAELPESKVDGKIARHLDRDDMVANTIGTFASVTVHCAQCHNHKFDPIPQADYYALQAVFAALDRAEMKYIVGDGAATRELN
jgi:mono/diheme cytochrome c family protein